MENYFIIRLFDPLAYLLKEPILRDVRLNNNDLLDYLIPVCQNWHIRRHYRNHLHHLLDSIKAKIDAAKILISPGSNYGDYYYSNDKLFRHDDIGTFNLNKKDPNDNGIITRDYKLIYIDVVCWIKHLEALVLAKPHCKAVIIKSVYLGLQGRAA